MYLKYILVHVFFTRVLLTLLPDLCIVFIVCMAPPHVICSDGHFKYRLYLILSHFHFSSHFPGRAALSVELRTLPRTIDL